MKKKKVEKKPEKPANFLAEKTDPNGSWTGVPLNPTELPQQDADDL